MDIQSDWLTPSGLWLSWVVFVLVNIIVLFRTQWHRLLESESSNIYFAAIVGLFLLWSMRASPEETTSLHLLGASLASLMFGWEFAFIAIQAVLLLTTLTMSGFNVLGGWPAYAINSLLHGLLPAVFTYGLLRLTQRLLPHNYFIYFFLNTFFATIAGIVLVTAVVWLLHLSGFVTTELKIREFSPFMLLLAFPEGMFTGMLISIFVVYKPEWVTTFRDEVYLQK